eukprot:13785642-Ditylum_brightwellii.AAC.1
MAKRSHISNLEICHQGLDSTVQYSPHKGKYDQLHFSKGLNEHLSMTAMAKQYWLEAVEIVAKDFLAVHKMPPAQQTITQFFSSAPAHAATCDTSVQSCLPK